MAKGTMVSSQRQAKINNRQVNNKQFKLTNPRGKSETFTFRTNADGSTDILNSKGKPMAIYKNMSYDDFVSRAKMLGYR